jgi:ribosomal protein S18 acetylase RimI-like enzyme
MVLEPGGAVAGIEQISLSVTATQTAAIALHRSLGFKSFGREPRSLKIGDRFVDEEYPVLRLEGLKHGKFVVRRALKRKSALDPSVQDASAALPQNCQTTSWILESP